MAERRGIFQRSDLSRVQAHGLAILYDRDALVEIERQQRDLTNALKYAMVANDPSRITALFPSTAQPVTTEETVSALDSGAPTMIETVVASADVEDFFRSMESGEFTISDLDDMLLGEGDY
jgi:hypothetical protein